MQGGVGKYSSLEFMQLQSPVINRNVFTPGIALTIINVGLFNCTAFWIGKKSSESSVSLCSYNVLQLATTTLSPNNTRYFFSLRCCLDLHFTGVSTSSYGDFRWACIMFLHIFCKAFIDTCAALFPFHPNGWKFSTLLFFFPLDDTG